MNNNEKHQLSRRTMLASSTAVVAGLTIASPLAADDTQSECQAWQQLIGQKFSVGRPSSLNRRTQPTLTLVGVEEMTADDPNRPADFRDPFILFFEPGRRGTPPQEGILKLFNPNTGRQTMFVNEVLNTSLSDAPILQAVFG